MGAIKFVLECYKEKHREPASVNALQKAEEEIAELLRLLTSIADQAHRATLVQNRSASIIKQACGLISEEAKTAIGMIRGTGE